MLRTHWKEDIVPILRTISRTELLSGSILIGLEVSHFGQLFTQHDVEGISDILTRNQGPG